VRWVVLDDGVDRREEQAWPADPGNWWQTERRHHDQQLRGYGDQAGLDGPSASAEGMAGGLPSRSRRIDAQGPLMVVINPRKFVDR
jgi:hypothetical protein